MKVTGRRGIQVRSASGEARDRENRKQRVKPIEYLFLHFLYQRRHLLHYAYDVPTHLTNTNTFLFPCTKRDKTKR